MTTGTIKAIETQYKGYRFRSRLEARWAVFFDALGVKWEYESEGYNLDEAGWYLPDFWLPDFKLWVEIKSDTPTDIEVTKLEAVCEITKSRGIFFLGIPENVDDCFWRHLTTIPEFYISVATEGTWSGRFVSDQNNNDWDTQISCPICGFDYVHFTQPVFCSSDNYGAWSGRGSAIKIPMSCENNCRWIAVMGFHKGNTFLEIEDAYTSAYSPGLGLAGDSMDRFANAIRAARSARFEHGEKPKP